MELEARTSVMQLAESARKKIERLLVENDAVRDEHEDVALWRGHEMRAEKGS